MVTDVPFRIHQDHPNRSIEITHILPLDCGLQRLAYAETVLRQLHEILVNSCVLVRPSTRVHRRTQNESANPNQNHDSARCLEDHLRVRGFDCVPVQDVDSVVED